MLVAGKPDWSVPHERRNGPDYLKKAARGIALIVLDSSVVVALRAKSDGKWLSV
jgi:hypothetical protein